MAGAVADYDDGALDGIEADDASPLKRALLSLKAPLETGAFNAKADLEDAFAGMSQSRGASAGRDKWLADADESRFNATMADGQTAQERRMQSGEPDRTDVMNSTGPLDFARRAGTQLVQSSPQLATTLGAAGAGFLGGEALFPAGGGIPAALLAAGAVNLPGRFGQNVREQLNVAPDPSQIAPGRAAAAAVPQAALDSLLTVLMPGGLAKPIAGGVLTRAAKGAVEQALMNAPAAVAQEAMTIFQANPDLKNLFDPESLKRMGSAAANATAVAMPLGAAGRVAQGDGSAASPIKVKTSADLQAARDRVETDPTDLQKMTGRYKKGFIDLNGLDIAIENPVGSIRSGTDPDGKVWASQLPADYGYVPKTKGSDGEPVDVYIGPHPSSEKVWVVDQIDPKTGKHDEHKAMLGFTDQDSALGAYDKAFSDGSAMTRIGGVREMPFETFKAWAKDGDTKSPIENQELPKTPADIHALAEAKGIKWDDDPEFMNTAEKLTGKRDLDDMTPLQLQKVHDALSAFGDKTSAMFTGQLPAVQEPGGLPAVIPKDPFYSALEVAANREPRKQGNAQQWLNALKKAPGVTAEELKWSGVEDFLRDAKGVVSKEDLLDHINKNGVKLTEVVKDNRVIPVVAKKSEAHDGEDESDHTYTEGNWEKDEPDSDYLSERASGRIDEDLGEVYDDPADLRDRFEETDGGLAAFAEKHIGKLDQNDIPHDRLVRFLTRAVDSGWVHPNDANAVIKGMNEGGITNKDWAAISDSIGEAMVDHMENGPPELSGDHADLFPDSARPDIAHHTLRKGDTDALLKPFEDAVRELHGYSTQHDIPMRGEPLSVPLSEAQRDQMAKDRRERPDIRKHLEEHISDKAADRYYDQELEWYNQDEDSPRHRTDEIEIDDQTHRFDINESYGEWSIYDRRRGRYIPDGYLHGRMDEARARQAIETYAMEEYGYNPDGTMREEAREEREREREENEPEEQAAAAELPPPPGDNAVYGGKPRFSQYSLPGPKTDDKEILLSLPKKLGGGSYTGGHWHEPDVVVHLRTNQRTLADGTKTTLMEEAQSDLHQTGREEGYKVGPAPTMPPELSPSDLKLVRQDEHGWVFSNPEGRKVLVGKGAEPFETGARFNATKYLSDEARTKYYEENGKWSAKVPDAPFKEVAEYTRLAFKRALSEAIKNGSDTLTWTTGDQQNMRWRSALRQTLNKVEWEPHTVDSTDESFIDVHLHGPVGRITAVVDKNGKIHESDYSELRDKNLSSVIGKDTANRITSSSGTGAIESGDLEIGKKAFRDVYDRVMVDIAKKIGAKYGATVGTAKYNPDGMTSDNTVHSLTITPQMREEIGKIGLSLFTAQKPVAPHEVRAAVADDVKAIINQITNGKANFKLHDQMFGGGAGLARSGGGTQYRPVAGRYDPLKSLIQVSMDPVFDATKAAAHESWHWIRQNGVFTPREIAALGNNAETLARMVKAEGLDPTKMSTEELEAHAFGRWYRLYRDGEMPYGVPPPIRSVFIKAIKFFSDLAGRVRRYGPTALKDAFGLQPDEVFGRAMQGQMAKRVDAAGPRRSTTPRLGAPVVGYRQQPDASQEEGR